MRMSCICLAALGVAVLPSLSLADLLLYEPFDYSIGSSLIGQSNTYVSSNPTWNLTGTYESGPGPTLVQGDATDNLNSLSIPGLTTAAGNAATLSNLPADKTNTAAPRIAFANNTTIVKNIVDPTQTAGTTVYYSLMLRVDPSSTDVGNTGASGSGSANTGTNQGIWFAGFNNNVGSQSGALTGVAAALTMHEILDTDGNPTGNFSLGVTDNVNGTANNAQYRTFDDSKPFSKGSTILVVASYTFGGTASQGSDTANLWINPDIGTFGQSAPVTTPDFTDTTNVSGIGVAGSPYQIASFFVRQNQFDPSLMTIDEVRVGTTWADVTPRDSSLITGDTNLDGVLDYQDFQNLNNGLTNNLTGWANGDLNGDGVVNADDFAIFQYNFALYGTNTPPVPEPAAIALLAAVGLLPIRARRRVCTKTSR